jgi:hypothetical protein
MKRRAVLVMAGAAVALAAMPQRASAQTVHECSGDTCAQVSVTSPGGNVSPNGMVTIALTFKQGADDHLAGGPDEIAALALTLRLSGDPASVPLLLNDCTLNADGLPGAVKPDPSISNFKVVIENASCASRTHCLCPDPGSGITPDNFVNLVIYGPNPLPPPGPIDIPTLPMGPQQLLTIDLKVANDALGTIPLHLYNQVQDAQHPQFTAFLSVGDKGAADQTCVPATGQPPCSGSADSQVLTTDASITVSSSLPCIGDKSGDGSIDSSETVLSINGFAQDDVSLNPAADGNGNGSIEAGEVVQVILNFATDACNPYQP